MSAFGPSPILPTTPGVVQSAFIAQQATGPKAREKTKPQDADPRPSAVRDEVRLSDPMRADAVDPKPDAAEEWKHRRGRGGHHDPRFAAAEPLRPNDGEQGHIDMRA
jgi:hypothetical protein